MVDKIFAPWRSEYILSGDKKEGGCIFCDYPKEDKDEENLIIHRGKLCFVIMNRYPYSAGHLMVIPCRHLHNFAELTADELTELMQLAQKAVETLTEVMRPDGFNLGMNIGKVAGAGIDQHLHLHVVPRWNGDTNFMPVVGDTRVISEALESAWKRLKEGWIQ
ncbi:MAG: HIT domain-containing protein [Synergistaceae bacterium]|nr:HIT domain-containing protein [Candidatus Equadaptatus faecalis]